MREHLILQREHFQDFLDVLQDCGYEVVGPTIRDGAVVYEHVNSVKDLPAGWTDQQEGGTYRLKKRTDDALFGYAVGPHSLKKYLHPPAVKLWQVTRDGTGLTIQQEKPAPQKIAFLGVRSCELRAIAIQDKVFLGGGFVDSNYQQRRESLLLIAVNCGQAGKTCFCVSMNAGPRATSGFDIAMTEVLEDDSHYFVMEAGTPAGAEILEEIPCKAATEQHERKAASIQESTARQMGRSIDTAGLMELLYRNYEHTRWENVAARCLTCGNCTMVCPTCFCSTVEDVTDLKGAHAERWQKWDSCFSVDFSYIHGGSVRNSPKARYRQWMTHKLATWTEQFGCLGCVGCGRCITWCPVGIDITEEVRAIREEDLQRQNAAEMSHGKP